MMHLRRRKKKKKSRTDDDEDTTIDKVGDEHRDLRVAVDGKINREMSFR
jgi:hypothetical protein